MAQNTLTQKALTPKDATEFRKMLAGMNHGAQRAAIRKFQEDVLLKRVSFADPGVLGKIAQIEKKCGFDKYANRLLENRNISFASKAVESPVVFSDLALPKDMLDAVLNKRDNPGLEWANRQIRNENWIFPNGVDSSHDLKLWNLYHVAFDRIKENFEKRILESEEGWHPIDAAAENAAKKMIVQKSSVFNDRDVRNYVREKSLKILNDHMWADKRYVHQVSVAIAYLHLYEETNIAQSLANQFVKDWNSRARSRTNQIETSSIIYERSQRINTNAFNYDGGVLDKLGRWLTGL
jgi:hypothetical protein